MNTKYKAHKTIKADIEEVAAFLAQDDMAQNYFPEVRKDTSGMSEYIHKCHKHLDHVFPDYQVPCQGLKWSTGNNTCIRLPRKDINANICSIEVEYKTIGANTEIQIQVVFRSTINLTGILAAYHVHMMVANKLTAIKRDIEANQYHGLTLTFA